MVKWENCVNATLTTGGGGGGGNGIKTLDLSKLYIKKLSDDEYVEYADPTSYEYISDYIYKLLSFHGQYLEEFEIVVDKSNYIYSAGGVNIAVKLLNYAYKTQYVCSMMIFDDTSGILEMVNENLIKLVQRYLADIKTKTKINNVKENNTMAQYTYGKFEVIKTQEEIELEEKLAKLKAEYDKKATKLREEYKAAKEKKERDAKAKELHDKFQSLVDAGFSNEQAYDILQTKMKLDEL